MQERCYSNIHENVTGNYIMQLAVVCCCFLAANLLAEFHSTKQFYSCDTLAVTFGVGFEPFRSFTTAYVLRTGMNQMIDCLAVFVSSFSSFSGKVLILSIFTIIEQLPLLRKLYWASHILFKYCLKTGFWKVFLLLLSAYRLI